MKLVTFLFILNDVFGNLYIFDLYDERIDKR